MFTHRLKWSYFLIIGFILTSSVACQDDKALTTSSPTPESVSKLPVETPLQTQLPTDEYDNPSTSPVPKVVLSEDTQTNIQKHQPIGKVPSPAPDPLRFSFPTSGPAPISAWRPPLYPIPWALSPYDHFYFSRPIAANDINWPLADYRYGGVFFSDVVHTGVDIPAHPGTPVLAAGPGKITWA